MNTDGVVAAEKPFVALDIARNDGIGGAILHRAVEAIGAKGYVQAMVGHEVVGTADGIGALQKAYGFDANGHVLRTQIEGTHEKENGEKAKCTEEREHDPSRREE